MSIDYSTWTREALFQEAMRLMNRADELLTGIEQRCAEKERNLCYHTPVYPVGKAPC